MSDTLLHQLITDLRIELHTLKARVDQLERERPTDPAPPPAHEVTPIKQLAGAGDDYYNNPSRFRGKS